MNVKVSVEFWDGHDKIFLPKAVITIEVPFLCGRINVIMEAVGELTKWFGTTGAPVGLYRLGGDEDAKVSWNGRRPKLHAEDPDRMTPDEEAAETALETN